eukprot:m.129849 g.129849  ORF g.129849 m.129849 type:complete len:304 (-) comp15709_c1_seq1:2068-2979(-)
MTFSMGRAAALLPISCWRNWFRLSSAFSTITYVILAVTLQSAFAVSCVGSCNDHGYTGTQGEDCIAACAYALANPNVNCTDTCTTDACRYGCDVGFCSRQPESCPTSASSSDHEQLFWLIIGCVLVGIGGCICTGALSYSCYMHHRHKETQRQRRKLAEEELANMEWDTSDTISGLDHLEGSTDAKAAPFLESARFSMRSDSQASSIYFVQPTSNRNSVCTSGVTSSSKLPDIEYLALSHLPCTHSRIMGSPETTTEYAEVDHVRTMALAAAIAASTKTSRHGTGSTAKSSLVILPSCDDSVT